MTTKVALIQLDVSETASSADRHRRVAELVQSAAGAHAQFVLLPELWPGGAFNTEYMRSGDIDFATFAASMSTIARVNQVWLHAGSDVELSADGHRYNTSIIFNPEGDEVARYRKLHLWGGADGEAAVLSAGEGPLVVDSPLGRTGITTCYELRFPELYRTQVANGAQTYLVVAGWPDARIEHWRTLLQARAIENQAWVLGVNCIGEHCGVTMGGFSAVVNPQGHVVAQAQGTTEEILLADVDVDAVTQWREKFRWLSDRRQY